MKKLGIIALALVAISATLVLPATSPAAGVKKIKTTVTFDGMEFANVPGRAAQRALGSYIFYGAIAAKSAKCRIGRKVVIRYKRPGKKSKLLGSDRSDSEGNWSLRIDFTKYPSGLATFQATAPTLKLTKSKLCKPDKSNTYTPT